MLVMEGALYTQQKKVTHRGVSPDFNELSLKNISVKGVH